MKPMTIRTSITHWRELDRLLYKFEKVVEACARLDAHRECDERIDIRAFDNRMIELRNSVHRQENLVTVEGINKYMEEKLAVPKVEYFI